MDTEHLSESASESIAKPPGPGAAASEESPLPPPDPAALVDRLIEAGEWPEPELLEQIVAAGEATLGPLLAFMRTYPSVTDHSREAGLYYGIGILSEIRSPAAIPVLVEIIKRYPEDSGEVAAEALGRFGDVGFQPALDLIQDPRMKGYPRQHAINAGRRAAENDPGLRARLAAVLRPLLADAMERTRRDRQRPAQAPEENREEGERTDGSVIEDHDAEEPNGETPAFVTQQRPYAPESFPLGLYEEVAFLISDLADLADPEARHLIKTAFSEGLVETWIVDEQSVEDSYQKGGESLHPHGDWLEDYRQRYRDHMERLNRPPAPPVPPFQTLPAPRVPPSKPVQATLLKTGPKLGRNDPCWCGSGKKYKKCHLGKDGRS
jgi:SEC-C motif